MSDTLPWSVKGETFRDGSQPADWMKIYQSPNWHWQYDIHELSFGIYEYHGQYWKLYHARFIEPGADRYTYDYSVACRMVLVKYPSQARSPHSSVQKRKGEEEWIRTYEYDTKLLNALNTGERNDRYGEPHRANNAA